MMQKFTLLGLVAGMTMAGSLAASATTITVSAYSQAAYNAVLGSLVANSYVEDFEAFGEGEVGPGGINTDVGNISTIPGRIGTGGSVIGTGTQIAVRDNPNFGRVNTTVGGDSFLDSNDTIGMLWEVMTGKVFTTIAFSLSDPGDQGAMLTITAADGTTFETDTTSLFNQANGVVSLVVIQFSSAISNATVSLANIGRNIPNDGFGIDDLTVGAVPLPAGAVLLLSGLGVLGAMRRRKALAA